MTKPKMLEDMTEAEIEERNTNYEAAIAQRKMVALKVEELTKLYKLGFMSQQHFVLHFNKLFVENDYIDFCTENPI